MKRALLVALAMVSLATVAVAGRVVEPSARGESGAPVIDSVQMP